jgi:putative DNA primase/helicase
MPTIDTRDPPVNDHARECVAAAMTYTAHGWPVLPVHGVRAGRCTCGRVGCDTPGKHPRLARWPELATTDAAVIARWWSWWPDANVGLATGSGLLVLDVDPRHGGDASLADLERQHGALPDTPRALTGGGGTHYLLQIDRPIGNKIAIAPGLDLRGDGGFIVAPPSRHASGTVYRWDVTAHPDETPLAPAPRWLLDLCASPRARASDASGDELHLVEGERNCGLFREACAWRRRGIGHAALLDMLRAVNAHHVDPPLPERELEAIAASAMKYPPARDDRDGLLARALGVTA